jgi:ABC-2 type transport system ATP-binding protein
MTTMHSPIESSATALEMNQACLDFGGGAGVFDLTLSLPQGTILGMIGPSGCGKTTTIRLLNGVLKPTSGEVVVFNKKPTEFGEADKAHIGYIPQQFVLYPNLSVQENMHFLGGIYGMSRSERNSRMQSLLEFVDLQEARKRLGRKLSGGMQRRLMLAGALFHDPDLLIADEPTAGIDPILRARIWENFRELRNRGKTLLVTTQYVGEAAYCDQVAVMRKGRLIAVDTPKGLQHQAMGGEVIHLQVQEKQLDESRRFLELLPQVSRVDILKEEPGGMHVLVEDSGKEIPNLLAILRVQLGVTPIVVEPHLPAFDEVFVRLIQAVEKNQQQELAQ